MKPGASSAVLGWPGDGDCYNAVRWLALTKWSVEPPWNYRTFMQLFFMQLFFIQLSFVQPSCHNSSVCTALHSFRPITLHGTHLSTYTIFHLFFIVKIFSYTENFSDECCFPYIIVYEVASNTTSHLLFTSHLFGTQCNLLNKCPPHRLVKLQFGLYKNYFAQIFFDENLLDEKKANYGKSVLHMNANLVTYHTMWVVCSYLWLMLAFDTAIQEWSWHVVIRSKQWLTKLNPAVLTYSQWFVAIYHTCTYLFLILNADISSLLNKIFHYLNVSLFNC